MITVTYVHAFTTPSPLITLLVQSVYYSSSPTIKNTEKAAPTTNTLALHKIPTMTTNQSPDTDELHLWRYVRYHNVETWCGIDANERRVIFHHQASGFSYPVCPACTLLFFANNQKYGEGYTYEDYRNLYREDL